MGKLTKRAKANDAARVEGKLEAGEAFKTLKKFKGPKFDQSVEVCFHLGVDVKQADQMIRGSVSLPKAPCPR